MMAAGMSVAAAMFAAGMPLALVMVVAALDMGVKFQGAMDQGFHSLVCLAGNAAVQTDAGCCQRCLGSAADTAADQGVHMQGIKNAGQCPVTAAIGVHHLGIRDHVVCNIINLKLFCVAEVLENQAVFISDCNSHNKLSFWFFVFLTVLVFKALLLSAMGALAVTQPEVAAFDVKRKSVYKYSGKLFPGAFVDSLYSGSGNLHTLAALFLGQAFLVNQADSFILIHSQDYPTVLFFV